MRTAIGVMAEAPLAGTCNTRLLAAHGPEWVAGLHAAMLRDTLDGLQAVAAEEYVVFAAPEAGADAAAVLARHVPVPWTIVPQEGADRAARIEHALATLFGRAKTRDPESELCALLAESDAPSFPTDPIRAVVDAMTGEPEVALGASADGGIYIVGATRPEALQGTPWMAGGLAEAIRAQCTNRALPLHEFPAWYAVNEPPAVIRLLEEMQKHPERAPRTAQYLVTRG